MTTTASAICDPVCASTVPGHSNEEAAIVAEISWPQVLRIGHEGGQISLKSLVVESLEGSSIVKVLTEGVGDGSVLAEDVELDRLGPPVVDSGSATSNIERSLSWALALGHVVVF